MGGSDAVVAAAAAGPAVVVTSPLAVGGARDATSAEGPKVDEEYIDDIHFTFAGSIEEIKKVQAIEERQTKQAAAVKKATEEMIAAVHPNYSQPDGSNGHQSVHENPAPPKRSKGKAAKGKRKRPSAKNTAELQPVYVEGETLYDVGGNWADSRVGAEGFAYGHGVESTGEAILMDREAELSHGVVVDHEMATPSVSGGKKLTTEPRKGPGRPKGSKDGLKRQRKPKDHDPPYSERPSKKNRVKKTQTRTLAEGLALENALMLAGTTNQWRYDPDSEFSDEGNDCDHESMDELGPAPVRNPRRRKSHRDVTRAFGSFPQAQRKDKARPWQGRTPGPSRVNGDGRSLGAGRFGSTIGGAFRVVETPPVGLGYRHVAIAWQIYFDGVTRAQSDAAAAESKDPVELAKAQASAGSTSQDS